MTPVKQTRPTLRTGFPGRQSARPIYDGWTDGAFDLPDAVLPPAEAADRVHALADAVIAEQAALDGRGVRSEALERIVAGADAATEQTALEAVADERERLTRRSKLLHDARELAHAHVIAVVKAEADAIVAKLGEAFWEVIRDTRSIAPDLALVDITKVASIAQHAGTAGAAYLELTRLRRRLDLVHAALESVRVIAGRGREDRTGALRDTFLVPTSRRTPVGTTEIIPAGPADPMERLLWLAGPDAMPWLPELDTWTTRWHDFAFAGAPERRPEHRDKLTAAQEERKAKQEARYAEFVEERASARAAWEAARPRELALYPGEPR